MIHCADSPLHHPLHHPFHPHPHPLSSLVTSPTAAFSSPLSRILGQSPQLLPPQDLNFYTTTSTSATAANHTGVEDMGVQIMTARKPLQSSPPPPPQLQAIPVLTAKKLSRTVSTPAHDVNAAQFQQEEEQQEGGEGANERQPPPPPLPPPPTATVVEHVPETQSLGEYIAKELHPGPSYHTTDVVWGQTERDRVYNALLAVPFQLERLLWLGVAIASDSFLSVFTVLPLRVLGALATIALGFPYRRSPPPPQLRPHPIRLQLRGDQIYDLLCAAMFAIVVVFLWTLKAGSIYYWVKDMTQEFLKLSVLQTALELSDKICCSFLVDVLEALAASCTSLASAPRWTASLSFNVASDAVVALALLLAHGTVLMSEALVFGVAMNSQKNTLLALLIASNFTEIKGTVLKRYDPTKLFVLVCQDVVERFHLFVILSFVLVEEMSGTGQPLPSVRLLCQCGYVMLAEAVIDVTKHAVLGKFNEIRPGVYKEFTKDVCEHVATSQSHSVHRLVGFEPFAPAALFFRVLLSYMALRREELSTATSTARGVLLLLVGWLGLALMKLGLGYLIKRGAVAYLKRYDDDASSLLMIRRRRAVAAQQQHGHGHNLNLNHGNNKGRQQQHQQGQNGGVSPGPVNQLHTHNHSAVASSVKKEN